MKTGEYPVHMLLPGDVFAQGTVVDCISVCKVTLDTGRVLYLESDERIEVTGHRPVAPHPREVNHGEEAQHEAPPEPEQLHREGEAERPEPPVGPDPLGRAAGLGEAVKGLIPGLR
jgi:hypothetical protein